MEDSHQQEKTASFSLKTIFQKSSPVFVCFDITILGFPGGSDSKEFTYNGDPGSIPGSRKSPGEANGYRLRPVSLSGEVHGQRSLAGYHQWGHKESDTTE